MIFSISRWFRVLSSLISVMYSSCTDMTMWYLIFAIASRFKPRGYKG